MKNEHGYCPACNADLDGLGIWAHFLLETGNEAQADQWASMYGADRTQGKWGRAIAIYDLGKDRIVAYRCPDCNYEWGR